MNFRVLLADADGTLFDFYKGEAVAIVGTLERFGIEPSKENIAAYSEANEKQWKMLERGETTSARLRIDRFVNFLRAIGHEADPQAMNDDYIARLGQQRWPFDFSEELCRRVSQKMPIYLVTNGLDQVQRARFSDCTLTPYLSGILTSEAVGASKPDPKMLFEALRLSGVSADEAVLLGDSITADIAAANNAGIRSILFTNGKEAPESHGATWTVKTLEEACRLILGE